MSNKPELTTISNVEGDTEPKQISSSTSSSSAVIKKWLRCFVVLIVILLYLFVGALVFRTLERPLAVQAYKDFKAALHHFELHNDCVNEEDVSELMNIVTRAIGEGAYVGGDRSVSIMTGGIVIETLFAHMWSYNPNFMLVTSIVTTIGFGYTAPRTDTGQFFCVLYAVVGIPFLGTIIWSVGEILKPLTQPIVKFSKRLHVCKVYLSRFWTPGVFLSTILVAYLILMVPSSIFHWHTRDWNWLVCMYFSMVAMTTIGFGDLQVDDYPGHGGPEQFFVGGGHLLLFIICIATLSIMFNTVSKAERKCVKQISAHFKAKHNLRHQRDVRVGETSTAGVSFEESRD